MQSATNGYNRSKYHATKANSFEEVLSFKKVSYCVVFLFVFELQWSIISQAFHYLMTLTPD